MINRLQRLLYTAGILAPYLVIAAIFSAANRTKVIGNTGTLSIQLFYIAITSVMANLSGAEKTVILVAIVLLIYHCVFLRIILKKLSGMDFQTEDVPMENDNTLIALSFTYLLPVISWVRDSFVKGIQYLPLILTAGILTFLYSVHSNEVPGSPIYTLFGYHFHIVTSKSKKQLP